MPTAQWPLLVALQGDGTWGPVGGTQVCITSFTSENLPLPFKALPVLLPGQGALHNLLSECFFKKNYFFLIEG